MTLLGLILSNTNIPQRWSKTGLMYFKMFVIFKVDLTFLRIEARLIMSAVAIIRS